MTTKKKIIEFLDKKNNNTQELELTDFLQENNINYMYFENIKELFKYYNEDFNWNTIFFDNIIVTKDESIIILLD